MSYHTTRHFAWHHQAITWTKVDLSLAKSCGIYLRVISQEMLKLYCLQDYSRIQHGVVMWLFVYMTYAAGVQIWIIQAAKISKLPYLW